MAHGIIYLTKQSVRIVAVRPGPDRRPGGIQGLLVSPLQQIGPRQLQKRLMGGISQSNRHGIGIYGGLVLTNGVVTAPEEEKSFPPEPLIPGGSHQSGHGGPVLTCPVIGKPRHIGPHRCPLPVSLSCFRPGQVPYRLCFLSHHLGDPPHGNGPCRAGAVFKPEHDNGYENPLLIENGASCCREGRTDLDKGTV